MQSSLLLIRRLIIETSALDNLLEYYKEGKLSHAYLISTNNTNKCLEVLLNVIKNIFCYEIEDENKRNSLCHLIDINSLPSLKIIEPDGNFIKKDQILELRNFFSKDSVYTKDSIYIIKNAEKMNKESANTMLKFLEEPEGSVIGFFLTNHIDNVMLTIQSRCQHIDINFSDNICEKLCINEEKYQEYLDVINNYLKGIEIEKKELILNNKKYLIDYEKNEIINIFKIILDIYLNVLNKKYSYSEFEFLNKYDMVNIKKKINLIIEFLKEINYNVNLDLLLDRFVIEMDSVNNESI